ncbi:hypothetical protein [Pseudotabrizicola sp. 4114]|uniref:hypothetical protein n=1 Tax=Pseudotabrizicola sp. 4114 TaxID=2817731 RepID=UPI00285D6DC1|nr:hypothetical protein [Pseudorhodobacter sp. 4114]
MGAKHYLTANKQPSPAFVEMSTMLDGMSKQIDELREMLQLLGAASEVIKGKAAKADVTKQTNVRQLDRASLAGTFLADDQMDRPALAGSLAGLFPTEGTH